MAGMIRHILQQSVEGQVVSFEEEPAERAQREELGALTGHFGITEGQREALRQAIASTR